MASYLGVGQQLPFMRMAQTLHDIYGADVSEGTLAAMIARGGERVQPAVEEIQRQLRAEPVVHFDETGAHVGGKLMWVRGAATGLLMLLGIDRHRGGDGATVADATATLMEVPAEVVGA
jgi:transposase